MKNVQITLDQERAKKLTEIANQAIHEVQQLTLPNRHIYLTARKVSASAIAAALLDQAIDETYAELP